MEEQCAEGGMMREGREDCRTEVYVFALGQCSGHRGGIALDRGRGDEAAALHHARQLAGGGGRGRQESGGEEKESTNHCWDWAK